MQICRSKQAIRDCVADWRGQGQRVALVATMGALHQGHMRLLDHARDWLDARDGGRIVVSIFVNPTQFEQKADLEKYPRDEENDLRLLRENGCDAVFMPPVEDIYRPGAQTFVEVSGLSRMLMGRLRPGHFRGMTTIVTKLFNIIGPDASAFGEKDYQQLTIVRQMVADLDMPVEILPVPTVREADGLAMSSRNRRLTTRDRAAAPVLSRALDRARAMVAEGTTPPALRREIRRILRAEPRADIRSVDIRDAADLSRIDRIERPVVILLAVRFGEVLLIDQRIAQP
ncbi:MAG: pantoate--beta-alanine ligase [Paracoccus sp. (in: a-proteobacteria)]|jgi:pantoate--beta-alanine ligase|uniref:pantoate--beta-alanine ligase n=1 Tax=unclassified Paracoccus (in: a-proteobacteria) TaxID=2688777 RepID=UPI000C3E8D2A|nr:MULTISPECIES: pantoate--beta-alanine ligase [unclassified Paracoccus (in: a-proteobacteria)]MBA48784.1 pantoate--beta-alanine ligase [Paracoccus sp. (in: a-proteobacteria)]|tara:strand:- start:4003 stop:4860 length:858 start_codon:yes stop_codon:yes gene_type:complete